MTVRVDSNIRLPQEVAMVKDPFTRLLDLTLGWAEYVANDEVEHPDSVKSDALHSLYQSVVGFAEPVWDAAPDAQKLVVRQFVETQLLPLLLGKSGA